MIIFQQTHLFYQFVILVTIIKAYIADNQSQQDHTSNQLFHILGSLQPFRSQFCQFKFENCIQDSSYADQLDNDCNIYSRLRDCFRSLLDEKQCLTIQLKRQYKKVKQNEYDSCGIALSLESIHSTHDTPTSSSSSQKRITQYSTVFFLLIMFYSWNCKTCSFSGDRSFFSLFLLSHHMYVIHIAVSIEYIHAYIHVEIMNTFNSFKWYLSSALWSR